MKALADILNLLWFTDLKWATPMAQTKKRTSNPPYEALANPDRQGVTSMADGSGSEPDQPDARGNDVALSNLAAVSLAQYDVLNPQVPVIDLGGAVGMRNPETIARVAGDIGQACRDWGLFQIVNHGIDLGYLSDVWRVACEFFALSISSKRALERSSDNPWGYFDWELTKNIRDKKENFDIGPEVEVGAVSKAPFFGTIPWPAEKSAFEAVIRANFNSSYTSFLRLNYYSVEDPLADLPAVQREGADLGVHGHFDVGAVTILIQDQVGGLQVFKDGMWYGVKPVEGAFVINIGDMAQVWSNDEYRPASHPVVAMDRVDRYSIPFFFNPSYDTLVEPLGNAVAPRQYTGVHWGSSGANGPTVTSPIPTGKCRSPTIGFDAEWSLNKTCPMDRVERE
jgi:isopenicillin N synthase-like dioxygenase